jgi:hypothetical protein
LLRFEEQDWVDAGIRSFRSRLNAAEHLPVEVFLSQMELSQGSDERGIGGTRIISRNAK